MPVHGPLSHIDISISDPLASIPFYAAFFEALGYRRATIDIDGFREPNPIRARWYVKYPSGESFGIEIRPSSGADRSRPIDRYAPGIHHMAFHAESPGRVDQVHEAMSAAGATVLDAPTEYGGAAYAPGYYAGFYADPDGLKLEVVYEPRSNP